MDHVDGHAGDWESRFWDQARWEALCPECHNVKGHRTGELSAPGAVESSPLGFGVPWAAGRRGAVRDLPAKPPRTEPGAEKEKNPV